MWRIGAGFEGFYPDSIDWRFAFRVARRFTIANSHADSSAPASTGVLRAVSSQHHCYCTLVCGKHRGSGWRDTLRFFRH
jgi:hypothetical protein